MTAEIKPKSKSCLHGFVPELRKVRAISWPREGLHTVLIWFLMSAAKQSWNLIHLQPQVMSRLEFQRCAQEISLYKPQADGLEVKVMSFYILLIVCILNMGKKYHFSICVLAPLVCSCCKESHSVFEVHKLAKGCGSYLIWLIFIEVPQALPIETKCCRGEDIYEAVSGGSLTSRTWMNFR